MTIFLVILAMVGQKTCEGTVYDYIYDNDDGTDFYSEDNSPTYYPSYTEEDSTEDDVSVYYPSYGEEEPEDDCDYNCPTPASSSPRPDLSPLYKVDESGDISNIPVCEERENTECNIVRLNITNLHQRNKLNIPGVGNLYLDDKDEDDDDTKYLTYSGDDGVRAHFTYKDQELMGSIYMADGKVEKIQSCGPNCQVLSVFEQKEEDDPDEEEEDFSSDGGVHSDLKVTDSKGTSSYYKYPKTPWDKSLLAFGAEDEHHTILTTITVYYNTDAAIQMMKNSPQLYIRSKIMTVNQGYQVSNAGIRLKLHKIVKEDDPKFSDAGLSDACTTDVLERQDITEIECKLNVFKYHRGMALIEKAKIRKGANMAVLLVNQLADGYCGKASKVFDVARTKQNLAIVSVQGSCELTLGHEIGHFYGLAHQRNRRSSNPYVPYAHGYNIPLEDGQSEGSRTIMAKKSGKWKHRVNQYSSSDGEMGSDEADNARALRNHRFMMAAVGKNYTKVLNNKKQLIDSLQLRKRTCPTLCTQFSNCPSKMTPLTFSRSVCGQESVCCQPSVCQDKFPVQEVIMEGWFVIKSRLDDRNLAVTDPRLVGGLSEVNDPSVTPGQVRGVMRPVDHSQMWRWDGMFLVSRLDRGKVLDGSGGQIRVGDRENGNLFQQWRFSDVFLVNAGSCQVITVDHFHYNPNKVEADLNLKGKGESKHKKWVLVEQEDDYPQIKSKKITKHQTKKFLIERCLANEFCTMLDECGQHLPAEKMKFCGQKKICCDLTVCPGKFDKTDNVPTGWFSLRSKLNLKLLSVKGDQVSQGRRVVNMALTSGSEGQVWRLKDGTLQSQLDPGYVLDGSHGRVAVRKRDGGRFQRWKFSDGALVNAGRCEVLDVANGARQDNADLILWPSHGGPNQKWNII